MSDYQQLATWKLVTSIPDLPVGALHLWCLDLSTAMTQEQYVSICSATELAHAETLERTRLRFLSTMAIRRHILANYLHLAPKSLQFRVGLHGKPYVAWPQPAPQFNLSHSGSTCLFAAHWGAEIGVDLEQVRPRSGILAIAQRMFDPSISAMLTNLPEETYTRLFYYHWTRLEARTKAQGSTLFNAIRANTETIPNCISFTPAPEFQACIVAHGALPPVEKWGMFKLSCAVV